METLVGAWIKPMNQGYKSKHEVITRAFVIHIRMYASKESEKTIYPKAFCTLHTLGVYICAKVESSSFFPCKSVRDKKKKVEEYI